MPRGGLKTREPKMKEETALKILNAPGASKNFYYNLLDWGANNIVVIGLKEDVYYLPSQQSPMQLCKDVDTRSVSLFARAKRAAHSGCVSEDFA